MSTDLMEYPTAKTAKTFDEEVNRIAQEKLSSHRPPSSKALACVFVDTSSPAPASIFTVQTPIFSKRTLPIFPLESTSGTGIYNELIKKMDDRHGYKNLTFIRKVGSVLYRPSDTNIEVFSVQGGSSIYARDKCEPSWISMQSFLRQHQNYEDWCKPVISLCIGRSAGWRVTFTKPGDNIFAVDLNGLCHSCDKRNVLLENERTDSFET